MDTTFLCSWSPVEKDILALIEKSIFMSSSHDDAAYKQAIRQGNQPEEVLAWKPWCDEIASIKTRLVISNPTVDNLQLTAAPASSNTQAPQPCQLDSMVANMGDDETDELTAYTNTYCAGLQRKLSSYVVQPTTQTGLAELVNVNPLANVSGGPQSGNVLIWTDCNTWGEADSRPRQRTCPIGNTVFQTNFRGLLTGRCGAPEPTCLPPHEIYVTVSGGKDRRRMATKFIQFQGDPDVAKKDSTKTVTDTKLLVFEERAWRDRKGGSLRRNHGRARLSQHLYVSCNKQTSKSLVNNKLETYSGGCDLMFGGS